MLSSYTKHKLKYSHNKIYYYYYYYYSETHSSNFQMNKTYKNSLLKKEFPFNRFVPLKYLNFQPPL